MTGPQCLASKFLAIYKFKLLYDEVSKELESVAHENTAMIQAENILCKGNELFTHMK